MMKLYTLPDNNPFYTDDWCVVMLLQGVCFKFLKRFEEAERCFQGVIDRLWNILNLLILAPGWLLSVLLKSRLFTNTVFQGINALLLGTFPSPPLCRSQEVQHDHYVVAAATMELGLLYIMMEKIDEAERQLDIAKWVFKTCGWLVVP